MSSALWEEGGRRNRGGSALARTRRSVKNRGRVKRAARSKARADFEQSSLEVSSFSRRPPILSLPLLGPKRSGGSRNPLTRAGSGQQH